MSEEIRHWVADQAAVVRPPVEEPDERLADEEIVQKWLGALGTVRPETPVYSAWNGRAPLWFRHAPLIAYGL